MKLLAGFPVPKRADCTIALRSIAIAIALRTLALSRGGCFAFTMIEISSEAVEVSRRRRESGLGGGTLLRGGGGPRGGPTPPTTAVLTGARPRCPDASGW